MTKAIRWTPQALEEYQRRTQNLEQRSARPALVQAAPSAPKRSKYASRKIERDGEKFDSQKEAARFLVLERMLAAGQIGDLKRQVSFVLAPAVHLDGEDRKKPAIRYWADFTYVQGGQLVVEDVKSTPTRKLSTYRIKRHLMATVHGIQIKEV